MDAHGIGSLRAIEKKICHFIKAIGIYLMCIKHQEISIDSEKIYPAVQKRMLMITVVNYTIKICGLCQGGQNYQVWSPEQKLERTRMFTVRKLVDGVALQKNFMRSNSKHVLSHDFYVCVQCMQICVQRHICMYIVSIFVLPSASLTNTEEQRVLWSGAIVCLLHWLHFLPGEDLLPLNINPMMMA